MFISVKRIMGDMIAVFRYLNGCYVKKEPYYSIVFQTVTLGEQCDMFLYEIISSLPLEVLKEYLDFYLAGWTK